MKQKIVPITLAVAAVICIIIAGYYFFQYQKTKELLQTPVQSKDSQTQALINKVGSLIELPISEVPTIATVSDVKKLSAQPFFAKARNGDKVLIYSKSGKAILYRESNNKIIEVSTLNVSGVSPSPTPASVQTASVSVDIYNGTGTTGLAKTAGQKISAKFPDDKITTADAANSDYAKTQIIDLSGKNSKAAADLASLIGGKVVSSLPTGETKPSGDILIIVGADFTGN